MRIIQILQRPQFRGAETFALQLSEQLLLAGHEVDILFLFGSEKDNAFSFELNYKYLQANAGKRWWDFKAYKGLNQIIKSGKYDIVQANAGDTLKYAALSRKIYKWKARLVFRNANKISDFLDTSIKKILNQWLIQEVDFVASVSNICKEDFNSVFQFPPSKIAALPIGTNVSVPEAYTNFTAAGITIQNQETPVFLHVGSFVPEKNHQGLIRIFQVFKKQFPNAQLLLIGKGKLESTIKDEVREKGLQNDVHFLGGRNDVLKIMPLCSALVMPSLIEGLPGVILEAMVSGLPVTAYNVGGIGEVVKNDATGFLVEKGDENGFISAMTTCIQENNDHIIQAAYQLVRTDYDNKKIASDFLYHYKQIIKA